MPTKLTDDVVLDNALDYVRQNADRLCLCEGAPANFTDATTLKGSGGNALAIITGITSGNFGASANGDVSGRKMAFSQLTGNTITEAGTLDHIVLADSVGSDLLHITPEDEENGGTAQAGAPTSVTLAAAASASDDFYNGMTVEILTGPGAGEFKTITDYVGSTRVATVNSAWTTNPTSSSTYTVYGRQVSASDDVTVNAFDIEFEDPN